MVAPARHGERNKPRHSVAPTAHRETGKDSKLGEAKSFLRAALSKRERPADEIKKEAAAQNIKWGTLKRASEEGVIKRKDGMGGPWFWRLS
jgi:hypothetical protein